MTKLVRDPKGRKAIVQIFFAQSLEFPSQKAIKISLSTWDS